MNPPISANEGTTATIIVISSNDIICANIGDSDAFLLQDQPVLVESSTEPPGGSPVSNTSLTSVPSSDVSLESDETVVKRARISDEARSPTEQLELIQMSVTDTPVADDDNEDYARIRLIAKKRASLVGPNEPKLPSDGILRSVRGPRFNYVSVPGARSLNMVRAFGNFGNKCFDKDGLIEEDSPIISRPHVRIIPRDPSFHAVVIGSDGLWDNLDRAVVVDICKKYLVGGSEQGRQCAKELFQRALKTRRKPDDISVVVAPLCVSTTPL